MVERFKGFKGFRGFRGEGIAAFGGDEYKVSVTGLALCLQCCVTECQSPFPRKAEVSNTSEPG